MNTSGFTQINIEDNQVGILFGLPAIAQIGEKETTTQFYQAIVIDGKPANTYSLYGIAHIMFAGYINWCSAEDKISNLPYRKFYDAVEDAVSTGQIVEIIKPIIECYENSRYVKPVVDAAIEKNAKKKTLPGTK